jgi:hypothetical protein
MFSGEKHKEQTLHLDMLASNLQSTIPSIVTDIWAHRESDWGYLVTRLQNADAATLKVDYSAAYMCRHTVSEHEKVLQVIMEDETVPVFSMYSDAIPRGTANKGCSVSLGTRCSRQATSCIGDVLSNTGASG